MIKKVILAIIIMTMSMSLTAYAGTGLSKIKTEGTEILSETSIEKLNKAVDDIPDNIINYFNKMNGKVEFINGKLYLNGYEEDSIYGLYYPGSSLIQIRADEKGQNNPNNDISRTISHEMGHFIFNQVMPYMSQESKETSKNNFAYWKTYSGQCYNESETFAFLYSWHKDGGVRMYQDTLDMFAEADEVCKELCGSENNPGPGFYL